jgi:hypothetical protein
VYQVCRKYRNALGKIARITKGLIMKRSEITKLYYKLNTGSHVDITDYWCAGFEAGLTYIAEQISKKKTPLWIIHESSSNDLCSQDLDYEVED